MKRDRVRRGIGRRDALKRLGGAAIGLMGILQAQRAPAQAKPVTLRYWTWQNSADKKNPRAQGQAQILNTFRKANPTIDLVEEIIPWQNLHQQLLQASAANKAPDVSRQLDRYLATLAGADAIQPLDDYVKGWNAARKGDYMYAWEDTTVEGKKFAFRQAVRPLNLFYYRTDLYSAAGFKTPPKTLKEWTAVSRAVTKGQVIGFAMSFSKSDGLSKLIENVPVMYWCLGSDLVDSKTGKSTFHLEAGQKIFQWFQDMVHVHKVSPIGEASLDSETLNQMFMAGTTACNLSHSSKWAEWSRKEAIQGKIDTAWTPNFSDEPKPVPVNTAGAWTVVMPRGAKKNEAWKLMEFLQSTEAELIDAKVGGELPTRKSTLKDPFFQTAEAKRMVGWLTYMAENIHPATTLRIKKLELLIDALADAAQQIISTKADVKAALAIAAQKYDAQI
ncbi:MAG: extracellular solute-binding protein [candidate division NC10 bacterium]|nr:extracellular solute-binding protein [candidate division NC10 bacterium]